MHQNIVIFTFGGLIRRHFYLYPDNFFSKVTISIVNQEFITHSILKIRFYPSKVYFKLNSIPVVNGYISKIVRGGGRDDLVILKQSEISSVWELLK